MKTLAQTARRCGAALAALSIVIGGLSPAARADENRENYIVVLKDHVSKPQDVAYEHARKHGAQIARVYRHALKGYAASLAASEVGKVRGDSRVAYLERDEPMTAVATMQSNATWGLDRIDQRALPLSTSFTYEATGDGVSAYIIDTGIRFSHVQFGGRAISGFDAIDGGPADDCNGHGTHVAGTAGGTTYGVAKDVTLVAVRVLDCSGSGFTSGVIEGVDWVTGDHDAGEPAVVNMSLGGGKSSALDAAVKNSINDGVAYAVAAGNGNFLGFAQNACNTSPARVGAAMTIGATDRTDRKASWSNYGSCVDWFAPGVGITSAWSSSNTATNTISGTSMAAPHTTGVAAQYLQRNSGATPAQVRNALYDLTTKGIVSSARSTNNHLLFTNR